MKALGVIITTVLFLFLGATLPVFAQEEHHEQEAKPAKQQEQAKPAKQEQQQAKGQQEQQQKQQEQAKSAKQGQQHEQQVKGQQEQQQQRQSQNEQHAARQSEQEQHRQEGEQRAAWTDHRAHNWKSEHRDWHERGGYNGYRIPEDRYRGDFGPEHAFRIYTYPVVIVGGDPRFQYGGFWFSAVDPWPEYWSANWYDNDDVYITYADDGYYLHNRRYPQDRIAIAVYAD